MRKKGVRSSREQDEYDTVHDKIINVLRREGIPDESWKSKRWKSELAKASGHISSRTLYKHLPTLPISEMELDKETNRWYLPRDHSIILKHGKCYSYFNVPKGEEIGRFICNSDKINPQRIMSIFDPLSTLFFDINPFFLRYIFRYALREKLEFLKLTENRNISIEELENLWRDLFGKSKEITITFLINPQKLLEWIEGEGRDDFKRVLPKEVWSRMCREASQLWKQREEWDKKLKPLEDGIHTPSSS